MDEVDFKISYSLCLLLSRYTFGPAIEMAQCVGPHKVGVSQSFKNAKPTACAVDLRRRSVRHVPISMVRLDIGVFQAFLFLTYDVLNMARSPRSAVHQQQVGSSGGLQSVFHLDCS